MQTTVEDALQASTRRAGGQLREYEHEIGAHYRLIATERGALRC